MLLFYVKQTGMFFLEQLCLHMEGEKISQCEFVPGWQVSLPFHFLHWAPLALSNQ